MTEASMKKYIGKNVIVVKNLFPYSVKQEILTGVVRPVTSVVITPRRGGDNIRKEHTSFYVGDRLIPWNAIKLIYKVEVVEQ